ncbi:mitogen-activated protein kinase kinase 9-like [Curcuma longa]|uniref:mitogen-activated protein kinase kinase 9-like n=1 Tax=Curcuma longa TaxID=136217 RepID=UPI003D9F10A7
MEVNAGKYFPSPPLAMSIVRHRRLPNADLVLELPSCDFHGRRCLSGPPSPPARSLSVGLSNDDPDFLLSDFDTLRVLGHGNGGTVYEVRHRRTAAVFALKVVRADDSLRHQVRREVDILRRTVGCRHVVRFHSLVRTPSADVALLLENMDLGSTDALLRRRGGRPFPEPALAAVARQALLGLAELHSRQIVHRDIKPANLLVNSAGEVKIADFGVGKVLLRSLDPCDSYVGTCAYMSPERLDSVTYGADYDPYAADVWSLGLAVLELHQGHFPLLPEGAPPDWAALMVAICLGEAKGVLSEGAASDEFRAFIDCCLRKESGKRWSVAELLSHPFAAGGDRDESKRALRNFLLENSDESPVLKEQRKLGQLPPTF